MHRFNFPRLSAVLVTAVVALVACAQGPGTPAGPPDTAPAFAVTVADQTFTEGEPISPLTLPAASGGNGPLSYSLTPSIPGLTFDQNSRTLSGTPTTAGTHTMTYRVQDGDANTAASDAETLSFTVTVEEAPEPDTAPSFGSQTVPVQSFTVGEAISALVLPAASGGNGSLSYSLTPSIPGLTFDQNSRTLSGSPTTAGTYNMTYRVQDGDANTAASDAETLSFTVTVEEAPEPDTAPSFGSQTVPDQSFTVGEAITPLVLPAASGGNGSLSYSLTPSIPGLTFDQNSRTLSGSPTTAGTYNMTYRVQDGDANTAASDAETLSFTVTVEEAPEPDTAPSFGSQTVPDQSFTVGEAITPLVLPAASGGNGSLSYSLTPSIPGLTFDQNNHTLTGSPTAAGRYNVEYSVEDGDANTAASDAATLTFMVTVEEAPEPDTAPSFDSQTVPNQSYTVGVAISALVLPAASGGNGPLSYSLTPSIPGLTFDQNSRTLTGTPTTTGTYDMTYQVQDGDANATASDAATLTFAVNVQPPSSSYVGCSSDAETWRGLRVCSERPREGYDRDDYGTGYRSLEDEIIAALPATMKADGKVYTPYSCIAFDITSSGTAATDIEHIVALAEAHDSGIADDQRRDFASDLDNLTIADPTVNRSQKGARDAAEWMPTHHGAWFAERVIQVKLEYGLTIDPAERDALEALLAGGGAQLNCVD